MSVPTTTMRIDPELKDRANKVLGELGLSLSGAVTIFLKAVVREQGLPIDMSIRSDKTDESNRQRDHGRPLKPQVLQPPLESAKQAGGGQALTAC